MKKIQKLKGQGKAKATRDPKKHVGKRPTTKRNTTKDSNTNEKTKSSAPTMRNRKRNAKRTAPSTTTTH